MQIFSHPVKVHTSSAPIFADHGDAGLYAHWGRYCASLSIINRNGSSSDDVAAPQALIRACHAFSASPRAFSEVSFVTFVGRVLVSIPFTDPGSCRVSSGSGAE
jgi:hypothetical protein